MPTSRKPRKKPEPKRVEVRNVNHPASRVSLDAAKYLTVRRALLAVLPKKAPGLTQAQLVAAVRARLSGELKQKAGWWTKSVHLDLEARGLVQREGKPLRWRLT